VTPPASSDLLALSVETGFVRSPSGRLLYENAPDHSEAPRLHLAGCETATLVRVRHDVSPATAQAIESLAADEPPLGAADSTPVHLDDYLRLLARDAPVQHWHFGLAWCFPQALDYPVQVPVIASDTPQGAQLVTRLASDGLPDALLQLGFASPDDFWEPWCAAVHLDEIASIAFAARLGRHAAATGVATVPAYRGQGFAAAATAAWAAHPALRGRVLFYGANRTNTSSQLVAQRLGLRFFGTSLSIT
jgi:hypothetical protein